MTRLLLLCCLALFGCTAFPRSPIVAITWPTGEIRCGGVAIDPRTIATAGHCVDGSNDVQWVTEALAEWTVRGSYPGRVIRREVERDLAWIGTFDPFPSYLPTAPIARDAPVRVWTPKGSWRMYPGRVLDRSPFRVTTDIGVAPGWSGSPLLDTYGFVVGILTDCDGQSVYTGLTTRASCTPGGHSYYSVLP